MSTYVVVDMGYQFATIHHLEGRIWSGVQRSGTERAIAADDYWDFAPDSVWEIEPPNAFRRMVVPRG